MATEIDLGIDHLSDVTMIGRGGFSVVYSAEHTLFKRRMAVKLLNPLTKESDRVRFERECEVMGRLSDHPHVVSVFNAGFTDDDRPYLLMELVEGGTLDDLLTERGRLGWTEAVDHLIPICEALGSAHRQKIFHRDVKPENILLTSAGSPRLADFGIASLRDATGSTSTEITASMLHTAPETFANQRDERSDVYSVASTLYTLIVGRAPFWREEDQSIHPLISRLMNDPPPGLPPELAPPELSLLIQRSLAKNPDHRPQTAEALARELTAIRSGTSDRVDRGFVPPESTDGRPRPGGPGGGPPPFTGPGRPGPGHPPGSRNQPGPGLPPGGAPRPSGGVGQPVMRPHQGRPGAPTPQGPRPPQTWADQAGPGRGPSTSGPAIPGWYHAPGDPPGTHRHWDGMAWQSGPVPVHAPPTRYASLRRRVAARTMDLAVWGFLWLLVVGTFVDSDDTTDSASDYAEMVVVGLASTALIAGYEILLVATVGATFGKLMTTCRVVREDGSPAGLGPAVRRILMFVIISAISSFIFFIPIVLLLVATAISLAGVANGQRHQATWDKQAKTIVVTR